MTNPKVEVRWPKMQQVGDKCSCNSNDSGFVQCENCQKNDYNQIIEACILAHTSWLKKAVPRVEDVYMELCLEAGNKERGDVLNSREKELELQRYATAIHALMKERMGG